jgi:hypothetical protein
MGDSVILIIPLSSRIRVSSCMASNYAMTRPEIPATRLIGFDSIDVANTPPGQV